MMDTERQRLIEHILELGARIFGEMLPTLPRELLHLDLTMPQLKVVLFLFLTGPARMSDISSSMTVSLATATGVVDRLVERGLLLRDGDPHDRRVVRCSLSEKGQRLVSELWQSSQDRSRELLEAIEPAKLRLVAEALEAMLQAAAMEGRK